MSSELLSRARDRSRKRKELLQHMLGVDDLAQALGRTNQDSSDKADAKKSKDDSCASTPQASAGGGSSAPSTGLSSSSGHDTARLSATDLGRVSRTDRRTSSSRSEGPADFNSGEGQEFRDSTAFLKGTSSLNPHNDYSQNFVDTEQRPQNFIRDVGLADRFEEYPKLRELIRLKNDLVAKTAHPPMYLKCDLETFDLKSLGHKFDVILIEPPLEEYARSYGVTNVKFWDWEKIMALDIAEVAASRCFVFLWCGSSDGLDLGRLCLQSWGFRRSEDICWIQTNHKKRGAKVLEPNAVFQRTKEHCLMGIKGTVRRSSDGDFIHANVDIDLVIDEEAEPGSLDKPTEMFHIIEHFCLGRRRLHIFGRDSVIRPGWLSLGSGLSMSNYDESLYKSYFAEGTTTGCTERIESLRPKTPPLNPAMRGRGERGRRGGGGRGERRGR